MGDSTDENVVPEAQLWYEADSGELDDGLSELDGDSDSHFRAPWKNVAGISALLSVAAITALAVVLVTQDQTDSLATIALVLAIVAFGLQIMIFAVQTRAASEQELRSRTLHTDTSTMLKEISALSKSTEWLVRNQVSDLLEMFREANRQTALDSKLPDPDLNAERSLDNLSAAVSAREQENEPKSKTTIRGRSVSPPLSKQRKEQLARALRGLEVSKLTSFPEEDQGKAALETLNGLEPACLKRLKKLALDALKSKQFGTFEGLLFNPDTDEQLLEKGLAKRRRRSGETYSYLSGPGIETARPLVADGDIPGWLTEALPLLEAKTASLPPDPDEEIPF